MNAPEQVIGGEIAVIPKESALQVFTTTGALDPYLAQVRAELDAFKGTADVATKKGRDAIASMAYKVARTKSYLESVGKDLADIQKEIPKKIDAARKHVRDTLETWKDEVRKPLTEWEATEKRRVDALLSTIAEFDGVATDREQRRAKALRDRLAEVRAEVVTEERFGEYFGQAVAARDAAVAALERAIPEAEKREADAAELAKLRQEAAARAQQEREQQIAREAAERARIDAEQQAARAKAEAETAAQREREAAERRELALKLEAEQAQRRAAEAEQAARAKVEAERRQAEEEARKREENRSLRRKVNNAAVAAFVAGGLDEAAAKLAVELIAKRAIPAVSIAY